MWNGGWLCSAGIDALGSAPIDVDDPLGDQRRDLVQGEPLAAEAGHREREVVAEEAMELLDRLDQHVVHRHPDRPAPVGVAAEQGRVRLARHILDHRRADAGQDAEIAMLGVNPADAAHAVGREELLLVQQPRQDPRQHGVIDEGEQVLAALVLPVRAGADVVAVEHAALVRAQALAEARRTAQQPLVDHLGGEQRDQADHRVDVDAVIRAVGGDDQVLEEAGLGIPQRHAAVA